MQKIRSVALVALGVLVLSTGAYAHGDKTRSKPSGDTSKTGMMEEATEFERDVGAPAAPTGPAKQPMGMQAAEPPQITPEATAGIEAFQSIENAIGAIEANRIDEAQKQLGSAEKQLRDMYIASPGAGVLKELDRVHASVKMRTSAKGPQMGMRMETDESSDGTELRDEGTKAQPGDEEQMDIGAQAPSEVQGTYDTPAEEEPREVGEEATGEKGAKEESMKHKKMGEMDHEKMGAMHEEMMGKGEQMGMQDEMGMARSRDVGAPAEVTATTDFEPLTAKVEEQKAFLDPKAVSLTGEAQRRFEAGDHQAAEKQLRLARERLVSDLALVPVEDALARVVTARSELSAGNTDIALNMLRGLEVAQTQIEMSAPIVATKFDLRAAAAAAGTGNWERAGTFLDQASRRLQAVEAASSGEATTKIKPIADKVEQLSNRVEAGKKPKPSEFRSIIDQTAKVLKEKAG